MKSKMEKNIRGRGRPGLVCILLSLMLMLSALPPSALDGIGAGGLYDATLRLGLGASEVHATTALPTLIGPSAVIIDAKSGEVLYDKDMNAHYEPASTTKMITCILALENLDLDTVITIDSETPFTEGSRIYLIEGEELTVEEILYGLMLESANDCAVAIAKAVSGSVEEFAKLMNARAAELGARNTHFINPNGLHEEGHYSCAYDLAMIAKYGMTIPKFRELVSTYQHTIEATNKQETRYLYNTNRLLYDTTHKVVVEGIQRVCKYDGVTGIKTGYTSHAGGCLVAGAERNGTELIAVVLNSTDMGRFADDIALLDWGFENYYTARVDTSDSGVELPASLEVKRGAVKTVGITSTVQEIYTTLPIEASEYVLTTEKEFVQELKAPVEAGQEVGKIKVYETGELLAEIPVITTESVEAGGPLSIFGFDDAQAKRIYIAAAVILAIIVVLIIVLLIVRSRAKKRRKAARQRKAMEIARKRAEEERHRNARGWRY